MKSTAGARLSLMLHRSLLALVVPASLVLASCTTTDEKETHESAPTQTANDCAVTDHDLEQSGASGDSVDDIGQSPEIGTGYREGLRAVESADYAVATANPLASQLACEILAQGGNAADAVVTAQLVLGLTEPQSSGIGGGGYFVYYDAETAKITTIDGRETAPHAADENYLRYIDEIEQSEPLPDARSSGRSIGVPGTIAALEQLHEQFGKNEWATNFDPAIELAENGFQISPRMHQSVADAAENLANDPAAREYFLTGENQAKPVGELLKNSEYAHTLARIAEEGSSAFYEGEIAQAIVDTVNRENEQLTSGKMSMEDLASYAPVEREPLCAPYREKTICGMPPSSSGGTAVVSAMGILDHFELPTDGELNAEIIHLVSEAERLAYADRDAYVADPAFVPQPQDIVDPDYLASRAELIDAKHSMGTAQAGELSVPASPGAEVNEHGTTHISVIDKEGNAASATTSIEAAFGSFHMTNGFLLNNQLTDFSADPTTDDGAPAANRVEGSKRPRSSMSPTLVLDADKNVEIALGSPGGSLIIQYLIAALVRMIDAGMDPQEAANAVNYGAMNKDETQIGSEHPSVNEDLEVISQLEEMGHTVELTERTSGLSILQKTDKGIIGGVDPRREGVVLGK